MRQEVIQKAPEQPKKQMPNLTGIPTQMKLDFERRSGLSFDDVRVHYNSDKPRKIGALAYTQIPQVHIGPGQERHLRHELGHVVQQKRGIVRPTAIEHGMAINRDPVLEHGADTCILTPTTWSAVRSVVQCSAAPDEVDDEMARALAEQEEDGPQRVPSTERPNYPFQISLARDIRGELTRHHVFPASKLMALFELVKPGAQHHNFDQFFRHMLNVIARFLSQDDLNINDINRLYRLQRRILRTMASVHNGRQNIISISRKRNFIEDLRELFVWDPANVVIGPRVRASDPGSSFDIEAFEALCEELLGPHQPIPIRHQFLSLSTVEREGRTPGDVLQHISTAFNEMWNYQKPSSPTKKRTRQNMEFRIAREPIAAAIAQVVYDRVQSFNTSQKRKKRFQEKPLSVESVNAIRTFVIKAIHDRMHNFKQIALKDTYKRMSTEQLLVAQKTNFKKQLGDAIRSGIASQFESILRVYTSDEIKNFLRQLLEDIINVGVEAAAYQLFDLETK